ncbi:hypothetical protein Ancab_034099, partial [Ancistrocladus abbreviatus]
MLEDKFGTGERVYQAATCLQGRSHTDSSIAIRPFILAHLANMDDETTISSLGLSEVPFTQGPIHSLEFQAYGTHSKRGVLATDVNQGL